MAETRDIASELLEKLQKEFKKAYESSGTVKRLLKLVESGNGTYTDANDYAIEVGELLAGVFGKNLSSEVLPDGRMYYNIAKRILEPLLKNNYELAADAAVQVQQALNEKALETGLKAVTPKLNEDRINGIVDIVSGKEYFDDIAYMLREPVINFTQSAVDDTVRENVNFQGRAGLMPKVVRRVAGNCCDWCSRLAGTYTYPDVPRDVYRRHKYCRCTVEYDPGTGKRQNVWTKSWKEPKDVLDQRRAFTGIDTTPRVREVTANTGPQDVLPEYLRSADPGSGSILIEEGYDQDAHRLEVEMAQWLHANLGGDIVLLNEANVDKVKTADYLWRDKLWDLKTTSSEKSANSAVRHGLQQIRENPGGIILNFGERDFSMDELQRVLSLRMQWTRMEQNVDIMIVSKGVLKKVLRY